jgi:hypothetical protein
VNGSEQKEKDVDVDRIVVVVVVVVVADVLELNGKGVVHEAKRLLFQYVELNL